MDRGGGQSRAGYTDGTGWCPVDRATGYSITIYRNESQKYGSVWYGNAKDTVPLRFVCKVVGEVFADNVGYMLEIDLGDGIRRALTRKNQPGARLFTDPDEYTRLQEES